ncbi:hypothetical protein CH300_20180 [Rhodococcus sp. 15-1154-1]|nr:hypothetical protein [Rhodococcus sp. 15-1154-1]OZF00858.1 hypothetical protein CH300_20180 [Rhodococcus sp. 15-1154-1]
MMIEELPTGDAEGSAAWTLQDQNIAMLVDRLDFLVNLEYSAKTTDPNDPEVKRRLAENKRNRVRPAPFPIYPPVAVRPQDVYDLEKARYDALTEKYSGPADTSPSGSRGGSGLSGWLEQMRATEAQFAEQSRSRH